MPLKALLHGTTGKWRVTFLFSSLSPSDNGRFAAPNGWGMEYWIREGFYHRINLNLVDWALTSLAFWHIGCCTNLHNLPKGRIWCDFLRWLAAMINDITMLGNPSTFLLTQNLNIVISSLRNLVSVITWTRSCNGGSSSHNSLPWISSTIKFRRRVRSGYSTEFLIMMSEVKFSILTRSCSSVDFGSTGIQSWNFA